jgi:hypothetical protein
LIEETRWYNKYRLLGLVRRAHLRQDKELSLKLQSELILPWEAQLILYPRIREVTMSKKEDQLK